MREQFHNLQALRGVACLLVVVYHLAGSEAGYGLGFSPLKPARWFGYAGVDLFFVLSGFIIASTSRPDLGRPARLPRYLFRRAWRIYPTFWAAVAFSIAVLAAAFPTAPPVPPVGSAALWETVLLLPQATPPDLLPVAWTLWYELMFYAAFAALFVLPRMAAVPALAGWAAVVVAVNVTGAYPGNRFASLATSAFVLEFLAGALAAWCPVRLTGRQAAAVLAGATAWGGAWSAVMFDPDPAWLPTAHAPRVVVFGVPAALAVVAATGWERGGNRPRCRWLEAVGNASYSVYLTHVPLLLVSMLVTIGLGWGHGRLAHLGWVAFMLAGAVLPGLLFYRLIERPLLNLVKKRLVRATVHTAAVEPAPVRKAA